MFCILMAVGKENARCGRESAAGAIAGLKIFYLCNNSAITFESRVMSIGLGT